MSDTVPEGRVPARVLLVGCGKLGTRLGERLVRKGAEVVALRRDPSALPESFTRIAADLTAPLAEPLPQADAMVITLPPGDGYRLPLEHLAQALPAIPSRVVFVSSTRVFDGMQGPDPITEADEPRPGSERARVLREGELLAIERFGAHIVRPAGIYGPGRDFLIRQVAAGTPIQRARRTNRIHETDLVRALHAMLTVDAPPAALHAVDQAPAPLGDVASYLADLLGVADPPAIEPAEPSGTVLDGTLLLELLGSLTHPHYRSGYDSMVVDG
ncbi:sugar nucleotide-binding protein [Agrococcus carbonis]|uniref:Nucleoside-diphosphate-sugar epimerase n=1 Tax=Agrococcus carbonis TaxID=684552 RepID=A0A1H1KTV8_9MICO|nr:sugar nucleotide-binding protein [Agrococcus carbonis]SDR65195.1 Nucleoside-diphosphate-sugar epimerase [Agrococcus carbonis]